MRTNSTGTVPHAFNEVIQAIVGRPMFTGARFGVSVYDLDLRRPIYEYNAYEMFSGASTTKIPTATFALALLGPNFRFRTRLAQLGQLDDSGSLQGDLVLVASGDPNLSGRVAPDDTLDFQNIDHSLQLPTVRLVERDPLHVVESFAQGVRDAGIRRITGTVLVDTHLFPDQREPGTETMVSPIAINDNLIDITVTAAKRIGERPSYRIGPAKWLCPIRKSSDDRGRAKASQRSPSQTSDASRTELGPLRLLALFPRERPI